MNISLFYVQGISRMDEPVFDTIAHQRAFFVSKRVASLEQAFYPPHYQDRIKLEIGEDISLTEAVNYLSLSFGGKDYYYFIDNLVYINEGVLEIGVTLDAIQTFMFNIHFINSDVSRKSIKRWNGSQINREYIRENAGEQLFRVIEYRENLLQEPYYGLLIKCVPGSKLYGARIYGRDDYNFLPLKDFNVTASVSSKGVCPSGFVYMLIPMPRDYGDTCYIKNDYNPEPQDPPIVYTGWPTEYLCSVIEKIQQMDIVESITFVNGAIFGTLGFTVHQEQIASGNNYIFERSNTSPLLYELGRLENNNWVRYSLAYILTNAVQLENPRYLYATEGYDRYIFDFSKNITQARAFNYKYCPQLIDENYYRVSFGEKMSYTAYPLHKLSGTSIYLHYTIEYGDNIRSYYITDTSTKGTIFDIYLTYIQCRSLENIALFNDNYTQYISQNYATLTRGVALAKQQNLYEFGTGVAMSGIDTLGSTARLITNIGAGNPLGVVGGATGITNSIANIGKSIGDFFEKDYVIDEKIGISKDNAKFKPDTVKQGNSASGDVLSAVLYPFYSIEEDINIVHAAEVFESYGYKVHEVTEANLFYLNLRYYYDVIQCDDMEIELTNYINDLSTINSIKARFNMGLRLWHTDNGVLRLDLGKVCYYDNVEQ